MEEIWKPFIKNNDEYEVSSLGRFRRNYRNRTYYLKIATDRGSIPRVRVCGKYVNAPNIVARAFLSDITSVGTAVPKDRDCFNMAADNLLWVPRVINVYDYCTGQLSDQILEKIR